MDGYCRAPAPAIFPPDRTIPFNDARPDGPRSGSSLPRGRTLALTGRKNGGPSLATHPNGTVTSDRVKNPFCQIQTNRDKLPLHLPTPRRGPTTTAVLPSYAGGGAVHAMSPHVSQRSWCAPVALAGEPVKRAIGQSGASGIPHLVCRCSNALPLRGVLVAPLPTPPWRRPRSATGHRTRRA
jgi:hypothetical protein